MKKNYYTRIGHGFCVTQHSLKRLKSENIELFEEFMESDYSFPLDMWHTDTCDYFFGILIDTIMPGNMHQSSSLLLCDNNQYNEMINEFQKYFTDWYDDNYIPHNFVMSCID